MNVKFSGFVICIEVIIYLVLYNLHDCTFKQQFLINSSVQIPLKLNKNLEILQPISEADTEVFHTKKDCYYKFDNINRKTTVMKSSLQLY